MRTIVSLTAALLLVSAVAHAKKPTPAVGGDPVEFTFLGVDVAKNLVKYRIKVNADNVSQVDLHGKFLDDKGAVVIESDIAWQNVVKSKALPIEKGKTYDVEDDLIPGSTKVDLKLVRVHYKDKK